MPGSGFLDQSRESSWRCKGHTVQLRPCSQTPSYRTVYILLAQSRSLHIAILATYSRVWSYPSTSKLVNFKVQVQTRLQAVDDHLRSKMISYHNHIKIRGSHQKAKIFPIFLQNFENFCFFEAEYRFSIPSSCYLQTWDANFSPNRI